MDNRDKIQHLFITHLLKEGKIHLQLPDGMNLDVGVTQQNKYGEETIAENYCWVSASRGDKETHIDSFGLEMRYEEGFVVQDSIVNDEGQLVNCVDVV